MNRPVSRTPLPESVVTSRLRGTGVPMSCSEPVVAGPLRIADAVDRDREPAALLEPPPDVDAPIATGQPGVAADGERHLAPARGELVGDLRSRGGGADHEDAAVGHLARDCDRCSA